MPKALLRSGLRLHYQRVGQGPDVVMIHGITGNLATWHLKIIPMLMDRFRILSYDLRGHGYSDRPPAGYSATDMAEDLDELLDVLNVEGADLIGHSFGADIALYFAFLHPERVRRVVAIEPTLAAMIHKDGRENWDGWDYWSEAGERFGYPVPPERRSDVGYQLRMSLEVRKAKGIGAALLGDRSASKLIEETTAVQDYEDVGALTLGNIPRIRAPVVLISEERSASLGTFHYLCDHLPDVRTIVLPQTEWGHFGLFFYPELIVQHLVERLLPAGSATGGPPRDAYHKQTHASS
jgi:pimeloyl-ACP methyl ester carboxylesterase